MAKKMRFNQQEYMRLRNEIDTRITLINSQSNMVLLSIFSAWGFGASSEYDINTEKVEGFEELLNIVMSNFAKPLIFLIPILYLFPIAIKSGENLIQLASLSAYIRVFFDSSSPYKNKMNWETSNNILSNVNADKGKKSFYMKFFNEEYTVLATVSFLLYGFFSIISAMNLKTVVAEKYFVFFVLAYVFIGLFSICLIVSIHRNSSAKHTLMKYTPIYVEGYIKRALELGYIGEDDVERLRESLNPNRSMDIDNWFDKG